MLKHEWGLKSGKGNYKDSKFSTDATVLGTADVTDSIVEDSSKVLDDSSINSSVLRNNTVVSGESLVYNSVLDGCIVTGKVRISSCWLQGCIITDEAIIVSSAFTKSDIFGQCVIVYSRGFNCNVSGDAYLNSVDLESNTIIEEGDWIKRKPIVYTASSGFSITENIDDKVIVGCTNNKIEKFLSKAGTKYGKKMGLSSEEIEEIQDYVRRIRDSKSVNLQR